jgi:protein involved in polysaccharide export with SLBB domain
MTARLPHRVVAVVAAATGLLLAAAHGAGAQSTEPGPLNSPTPVIQQPTTTTVPATVSSTIHAGDTLSITVFEHPDLTQTAVVQADGTIQYPLVGRVLVAGMSVAEARDSVASALKKYLKHPNVSVAMQQQGTIGVMVLGNVKAPGKYNVRSGAHIADAIAAASGVASTGEYPIARVSETDGTMTPVNLQKLLHDGDASQNVELEDNAIVYVTGGETIRVQVLGAVSRPGNVEINKGDHLSMAIARAGADAASRPDLNRVFIARKDPVTGVTTSYNVNLYLALEKGDQRFDPILVQDDKIYVPEAHGISPVSAGLLGILGRLIGF